MALQGDDLAGKLIRDAMLEHCISSDCVEVDSSYTVSDSPYLEIHSGRMRTITAVCP
jgi:hypothetical protein